MALVFNLPHSAPSIALILNANIIPQLAKLPVFDESSENIAHISGTFIFGGSATVQHTDGLSLGAGTFRLSFHYFSQK